MKIVFIKTKIGTFNRYLYDLDYIVKVRIDDELQEIKALQEVKNGLLSKVRVIGVCLCVCMFLIGLIILAIFNLLFRNRFMNIYCLASSTITHL